MDLAREAMHLPETGFSHRPAPDGAEFRRLAKSDLAGIRARDALSRSANKRHLISRRRAESYAMLAERI